MYLLSKVYIGGKVGYMYLVSIGCTSYLLFPTSWGVHKVQVCIHVDVDVDVDLYLDTHMYI